MKRIRSILFISLFSVVIAAAGQSLKDNFSSYAAGSDAAANWEIQDLGWSVIDGAYQGSAGNSVWQAAPYASSVTFSCDVTVLGVTKGDWLTAGIGISAGERNYWAVNLVAAPEDRQRKHSSEMGEMLSARWLAQNQADTHLQALPSRGQDFNWQIGTTYRLEISLTGTNVMGRILDSAKEVSRFGYRLNPSVNAVRAGRSIVRAAGLLARFDNAVVAIRSTAPEPKVVNHPWVSRAGTSLAKGTEYFRTCENKGRWWLLDPEGKPFFGVGVDHVKYEGHWCETLGYSPYQRNVEAKYGSETDWDAVALQRLKQWGFNTLAAGHGQSLRHQGLPHVLFAAFGTGFARHEWICEPLHWTGFPDVFSPQWESYCRLVARRTAKQSQGDPWCIGTFLDNELEWYGKHGHLVDEIFRGNPNQAAKRAFYQWLLNRFGNLDALNRDLGTHFSAEENFLAATNLPPPSETLDNLRNDFLAVIAERYFRVAAGALRKADPQHLVLGCRFAGRIPDPVLAAAGKYNDVFTINTYPRVDFENAWLPDGAGATIADTVQQLGNDYAAMHKPIMITEWSFPALDSGLPCTHGAGMRVDTQEQKAACYRIFADTMAGLPFVVGYHYFMWADEPAQGISSSFPENSNYGLVNEQDVPYESLVKTATAVNLAAASRHAVSSPSGDLQMEAKHDLVVLKNTNAITSHGILRITIAGEVKIEPVVLKSDEVRHLQMPAGKVWCVELQNWDTTKIRVAGGMTDLPGVWNVSRHALTNLPVVMDESGVLVSLVRRLPPGVSWPLVSPTNSFETMTHLACRSPGVNWACSGTNGSLFDAIQAGDLPIGALDFAAHQKLGGQNYWVSAEKVLELQRQELPDAWVIEAVVERAPANTGAAGFQARVRAVVFKGLDLVLVRPLWIENTDRRPWRLAEAYVFCRPAIGGSVEDDVVGGPDVPNYYRATQSITDAKLGGCFGAFNQDGWKVQFWKDANGQIHPDSRYEVGLNLSAAQRWQAGKMPYLWVYASKDADAWKALSQKLSQVNHALVSGGN